MRQFVCQIESTRSILIRSVIDSFAKAEPLIWTSSIYKFIVPDILNAQRERQYKEVVMDVTDSVPPFDETKKQMASVIDRVCELVSKKSTVLDFGAGKLRNSIYMLRKGYSVDAVEFEKTKHSSPKAKELFEMASSYSNKFQNLIFPHQFMSSTKKYDLILLINVCNIMPVPSERLLVLMYCRDKLNENGYLLWYNQHRDPDYIDRCVPEVAIGDGFYMKPQNRYQTFYRDFETYEITEMFLSNGFRLVDKFNAGHNHALVYKKRGKHNPLKRVLNASKIRTYVKADAAIVESKEPGIRILNELNGKQLNVPNPDELRNESLYIDALSRLPGGNKNATEYHSLITAALIRLFVPPLEYPTIEEEIDDLFKRVDIRMANNAEKGFFRFIKDSLDIPSGYIFIECKNYNSELGNPELDQLSGRLNDRRGKFGILTYRKAKDKKVLNDRCKTYLKDQKFIICLDDQEITELLQYKISDQPESIDELMNNKLKDLDF